MDCSTSKGLAAASHPDTINWTHKYLNIILKVMICLPLMVELDVLILITAKNIFSFLTLLHSKTRAPSNKNTISDTSWWASSNKSTTLDICIASVIVNTIKPCNKYEIVYAKQARLYIFTACETQLDDLRIGRFKYKLSNHLAGTINKEAKVLLGQIKIAQTAIATTLYHYSQGVDSEW